MTNSIINHQFFNFNYILCQSYVNLMSIFIVDFHPPRFDVSEKRLYINRNHINLNKPIFVARASDRDLQLTCGGKEESCQCGKVEYELKDADELFKIDSQSGGLFVTQPDNINSG